MIGRAEPRARDSPDALAPVRAMIKVLPESATDELRRALYDLLHPAPTAVDWRLAHLSFLTSVLNEQPQWTERAPYVARHLYDERRLKARPAAPSSGQLQRLFGTWAAACMAAWGLMDDGRSWGARDPWPKPRRHRQNYEVHEAVKSVARAAAVIGRVPSSIEYHEWAIVRRRLARDSGQDPRPYVPYNAVLRLVAPDRGKGEGWQLVRRRIFGSAERPPKMAMSLPMR